MESEPMSQHKLLEHELELEEIQCSVLFTPVYSLSTTQEQLYKALPQCFDPSPISSPSSSPPSKTYEPSCNMQDRLIQTELLSLPDVSMIDNDLSPMHNSHVISPLAQS